MKMKQQDRERMVLHFLDHSNEPKGPTEIGMEVFGYPYNTASSNMATLLRRLVKYGIIERLDGGRYRRKGL